MCRKATEIQELWKPYFGDFLFVEGHNLLTQVKIDTEKEEFIIHKTHTWLPRQDQLQNMIPDDCEIEIGKDALKKDEVWYALICDNKYKVPLCLGQTSEQALIKAIMHKFHKKKWGSGQWESQK